MAINNRAVLRDHERLLEREVTSFSECGQFAGWNPELMPSVAWMRMEFVQMTGYLLALAIPWLVRQCDSLGELQQVAGKAGRVGCGTRGHCAASGRRRVVGNCI